MKTTVKALNTDKMPPIIDEEEYSEGEHTEPLSLHLRLDNELFKDEDNIPSKVIGVKRINLPKGGEDWRITENGVEALILKGVRFTGKERKFLRSPKGVLFIIDGYKRGWDSVLKFKKELGKI